MYISTTLAKESIQAEQLNNLLTYFEHNPFVNFEKVSYGFENTGVYERSKSILHLLNSDDRTLTVEEIQPHYFRGTITTDIPVPFVDIIISEEVIKEEKDLGKIIKYAQDWRSIEGFLSVVVSADDRDNEFFYGKLKILPVPECLGNTLGWYHVVSPRGYESFFKRQDLLDAPAFDVEELEDGTICLMTYSHPLEFGTEENTARMIELTNYLYKKWREHDPNPTI